MTLFISHLHAGTPSVTATHRSVSLLRHPDLPDVSTRIMITRTVADPCTRTTWAYGARKLTGADGGALPDAITVTTLSGQPLRQDTTDGNEALTLSDCAGRPLWSRSAQGTVTAVTYEGAAAGGRPVSLRETAAGDDGGRMREKYAYSSLADTAVKACNLAGTLTAHHDNASITRPLSVSITGQTLQSDQRLLKPAIMEPDWATLTEADTEASLTVSGTYDATGAPLTHTNAAGVTTTTAYDINGSVRETRLRYRDKGGVKEVVTLKGILRRADGVVLSQTSGNGITDEYEYDPRTQFLTRHITQRPTDHTLGALLISDLHYTYDPAGNILTLEDKGTDPEWHSNAEATGLRTYTYDSLYRLASATGRERHPVNPDDLTAGCAWSPYTERYMYDDGNNLTEISHTGGSGDRTVTMAVASSSNRAVRKPDDGAAPDPEAGFLTGGLQKQLSDGRQLSWHADSQLRQVSPVTRDSAEDDTERYHYADGGTRIRKIRTTQTSGGTQETLTTYAGGTETRRRSLADQPQRDIVITEGAGVRLIENRLTGEIHLRYAFTDHLDSSGGETDGEGRLTSREEYLPYGGSAGSVEEAEESHDRTVRYSGKERDATGLLYYGWRYYQPETGRWLSADPGGLVDGINLFRFSHNNPISIIDTDGRGCIQSKNRASGSDRNKPSAEEAESQARAVKQVRRQNKIEKAYSHMSTGTKWGNTFNSKNEFEATSMSYSQLSPSINTEASNNFLQRFNSLKFNLVHFTPAEVDRDGVATFYSRHKANSKGLLNEMNENNTTTPDLEQLRTDHFSFFSLEVEGTNSKNTSRFTPLGGYKYTIPMDSANESPYFSSGYGAINDTLKFYERGDVSTERLRTFVTGNDRFLRVTEDNAPKSFRKLIAGMTDEQRQDQITIEYEVVADNIMETVMPISQFQNHLGLHIIKSAAKLSDKLQSRIFSAESPSEFDNIISILYRPQILVPNKLATRTFRKDKVMGYH